MIGLGRRRRTVDQTVDQRSDGVVEVDRGCFILD